MSTDIQTHRKRNEEKEEVERSSIEKVSKISFKGESFVGERIDIAENMEGRAVESEFAKSSHGRKSNRIEIPLTRGPFPRNYI